MARLQQRNRSADDQLRSAIDPDERLLWSARPDPRAMIDGIAGLPPVFTRVAKIVLPIACACLVIAILSDHWPSIQDGSFAYAALNADAFRVIGAVVLGAVSYRLWFDTDGYEDWVSRLAYGITDRRVLVLESGGIVEEYTAADISEPQIRPRRFTSHADVVWGRRVRIGGRDRNGRNRVKAEKLLLGLKGLSEVDCDDVVRHIKNLRQTMFADSTEAAQAFVEQLEDEGPAGQGAGGPVRTIRNSALDFSVDVPESWTTEFRKARVVFGKWGVESAPQWHGDPDAIPDWNVVKTQTNSGTSVEIQVAVTKPKLTLEGMLTSGAAKMTGMTEALEQEPEVNINGLPGFYLTRSRESRNEAVATGDIVDLGTYHYRQYVLHDGTKQYYVIMTWAADAESEKTICESIVGSLRT